MTNICIINILNIASGLTSCSKDKREDLIKMLELKNDEIVLKELKGIIDKAT